MNAMKSSIIYIIATVLLMIVQQQLIEFYLGSITISNFDRIWIVFLLVDYGLLVLRLGLLYALLKRAFNEWPIIRTWLIAWGMLFLFNIFVAGTVNAIGIGGFYYSYLFELLNAIVFILVYIAMVKSFRAYPNMQYPIMGLIGLRVIYFLFSFNRSFMFGVTVSRLLHLVQIGLVAWFIYQVLFTFDRLEEEPISEFELDENQYKFDEDFKY